MALVLVPEPDSVLLIRRAERDGDPWSGQIGLPGGRRGPEDADLVETAIRETAEEVGLDLTRGARLGALDDVVPRTPVLPPIAVRPWVFALDSRPPLALNTEVASAHWVPLAELGRAGVHTHTTVSIRGEDRVVAAFKIGDLVVWGMTERILSRFIEVIR